MVKARRDDCRDLDLLEDDVEIFTRLDESLVLHNVGMLETD